MAVFTSIYWSVISKHTASNAGQVAKAGREACAYQQKNYKLGVQLRAQIREGMAVSARASGREQALWQKIYTAVAKGKPNPLTPVILGFAVSAATTSADLRALADQIRDPLPPTCLPG